MVALGIAPGQRGPFAPVVKEHAAVGPLVHAHGKEKAHAIAEHGGGAEDIRSVHRLNSESQPIRADLREGEAVRPCHRTGRVDANACTNELPVLHFGPADGVGADVYTEGAGHVQAYALRALASRKSPSRA